MPPTPDKPRVGNPDWPDLVMIDGGKGQLSAVVEVLREMNLLGELNVVSLAKKREEIFLPGESLPLDPPRQSNRGAAPASPAG
jgi:excinuclease ABC subunit C